MHAEKVGLALVDLDAERHGQASSAGAISVGQEHHAAVSSFGDESETAHGGRPAGKGCGERCPWDPDRIDDHDRKHPARHEARGNAGKGFNGWANDEQAFEDDTERGDARGEQAGRRIEPGTPGRLASTPTSFSLSLCTQPREQAGALPQAMQRRDLDDCAAREPAIRQDSVEFGMARWQHASAFAGQLHRGAQSLKGLGRGGREGGDGFHVLNIRSAHDLDQSMVVSWSPTDPQPGVCTRLRLSPPTLGNLMHIVYPARRLVPWAAMVFTLAACKEAPTPATPPGSHADVAPSAATPTDPGPPCAGIPRDEFNNLAVLANLPLYWAEDRNHDGKVDPDEVAHLLFYPSADRWTAGGQFTPAFAQACTTMLALRKGPPPSAPADDIERRTRIRDDLAQGRPTLVYHDLRALDDGQKAFVRKMLDVAALIDVLFAQQCGIEPWRSKVPRDDLPSQSAFRRNWGPRCVAPKTENDPTCSAIPGSPKPLVGVYPASIQGNPSFCQDLEKRPDAQELLAPFVAVREQEGKLVAIPMTAAYPEQMKEVADTLREAGSSLPAGESALKAYLEAAAASFESNDWLPADEAWTKMNAQNSKWYVRVGPDETYWDPCGHKAGFHLTFALINQDSLQWQHKLDPVRQQLEESFAKRIGKPYQARKVTFHLPDFIDIVVNAGDDRDPLGATIGQSLPNWGKVAEQGRGRTVAMSNLYMDPDSIAVDRKQAESILDKASLTRYPTNKDPRLLSTILHEATHNLGPTHEYKYRGKTDDQVFGGGLSATMEELKAQTGALWYLAFLLDKGIISREIAEQSYLDNVTWAFGHIARGMYTADKKPKPYSQLAAIQIGFLMEERAITFDPQALAANGADKGSFTVHFDKLPAAIEKLMTLVGTIKATHDKPKAEELVRKYVDGDIVPQPLIAERILRFPKASFVYALDL